MTLVRLPTIFEKKKKKKREREKGSKKTNNQWHRTVRGINEHREYIHAREVATFALPIAANGCERSARFRKEYRRATRGRGRCLKLRSREIGAFSYKFTKGGRNDGLGNNIYIYIYAHKILYVYTYIIVIAI